MSDFFFDNEENELEVETRDHNLVRTIWKHDKDLYHGDNKKPGITTRIALVEQLSEETKSSVDQINKRFWTILIGIAATFGTLIVDIVSHLK